MESPSPKRIRILAYGVVGVLALTLIAILGYGFTSTNFVADQAFASKRVVLGGLRSEEAARAFDVSVLRHPVYVLLDRALFDAGRLPVPPPTTRGKVNLFGL